MAFEDLVLGQRGTAFERDALAAAIASSRIAGARWKRIRGSLDKAGHATLDLEQAIDVAKGMIRDHSRAAGRRMFLVGSACTALFVMITAVQLLLQWQTVFISASLLALGGVYTLVGLVKWITGANLQ